MELSHNDQTWLPKACGERESLDAGLAHSLDHG
jgi:hypothetical protein